MKFSPADFQAQLHALNINPKHNELFTVTGDQWVIDLSRHYLSRSQIEQLTQWLEAQDFTAKKASLFTDNCLNFTEQRAVNHVLLRDTEHQFPCSQNTAMDAGKALQEEFVKRFHAQQLGIEGGLITDLLTIGIGGSHLGANLVTDALQDFCQPNLKSHYLTGTDSYALNDLIATLNPKTTLVFVASKTFSTLETLWNYEKVKAWFVKELGVSAKQHFIAVTNNQTKARALDFLPEFIFSVPESVGGRFSLWSAIGLAMRLSLGEEHYQALLKGAHAMDVHFKEQPLAKNIPVLLAILDIFYGNCLNVQQCAVIPYCQRLRLLVNHLQQVEMESNGKSIDELDKAVDYRTGLAIWGGIGSNSQHSFHQWFYQGTILNPIDFIAIQGDSQYPDFDQFVLSQCLAQAKALWDGQVGEHPYQTTKGDKPSTLILLKTLNPHSLGELIALYEHKVFCIGLLTGTNAFDQFGVDAGKKQGVVMLAAMEKADATLDPITKHILHSLNELC